MYNAFAAFYDRLIEGQIDYHVRAAYFDRLIREYWHSAENCPELLLDLGCGTGSLSREFSALGYDVIGADGSQEMLAAAMGKNDGRVQFICQEFTRLDLFGTIDVAVCALDCLNHLMEFSALDETFRRVSLFTNPGGLFLFDVNTPYKHEKVLGNQTFVYDLDDVYCVWQNNTDEMLRTEISLDFFIRKGKTYARESELFYERAWQHADLEQLLKKNGFHILAVFAGDTEAPVGEQDERAVYVARKVR